MPSDLFISYARKDNVQGFVTALHDELETDYHTLSGRRIDAFLDTEDIHLFDDWRETILAHLQTSRLFLACLSPSYFDSDPCRWEWAEWIKHEFARGHCGTGIATIYFVQSMTLTQSEKAKAVRWIEDIKRRHGISFAPWFPEGHTALQRADARERLREVTSHLRDKLDQLDLARDVPGNLDAANPTFVGRLSELAQLHQKVRFGPIGTTTAVQGLGGMGKTALALHYAHAYAREYPGGRWQLRCASQHDLATVITQINETLQLTWTELESKDTRLQAERILRECAKKGHTLLLLDNVDSPALLSAAQTSSLLKGDWLHTLFTTRLPKSDFPGLPAASEFLTLDSLDPFDALQLLRQHQPNQVFPSLEEEGAAAGIIEALDGLTLAIETAAIYLSQHAGQIKPSAYLHRLRQDLLTYHDAKAQQVEGAVRHSTAEVTATLRPTLETLSPAAHTILVLAALSAPDAVVLSWLREVAGKHHPELLTQPEIGELDPWTEIITRLIGLRLFRPTEEPRVLTMHRVLQDVVLRCHTGPLEEMTTQLHAHASLRSEFLWDGWVHHENRWEIMPLAETARCWMTETDGIGRALAGAMNDPLRHLMHLGIAESLLLAALQSLISQKAAPFTDSAALVQHLDELPVQEDASVLLNNLAIILRTANRPKEAELMMLRALVIDQATCGFDHPDVATHINNLALLLQDTFCFSEAEPLMRHALAVHEASFGPEHPKVATDLDNLAQLLLSINRPTEAEPLMRRALAIDEASFGPEHPNVARDLSNLAQLLKTTNCLAEAEPLMRRALAIDEASFGSDHPNVAIRLNNLAMLLQVEEYLVEAEALMRRALAIDETSFGSEHPNVAIRLNNLANLLDAMGRLAEAEPLMRRSLAIDEQSLGPDHPKVAIDLNNLAMLLQATDRLVEAEPLMRRHVVIFLHFTLATSHQHQHLGAALRNYAHLLQQWKGDEAVRDRILSLSPEAGMDETTFQQILVDAFGEEATK